MLKLLFKCGFLTVMVLSGAPLGLAEAGIPEPVADLMARINEERTRAGLETLGVSPALMEMAGEWAGKLACEKKHYHRKDLLGYCRRLGYRGMNENLHVSTSSGFSVEETMASWMASPAHRRNLLMPQLRDAGLAYAIAEDGRAYVVFNGGVPLR